MLILWLGSPIASAQGDEFYGAGYQRCSQNSTLGIVECLTARTDIWRKTLDRAYQSYVAKLSPPRRQAFEKTQNAWIEFRDLNCRYYASGEGSISQIEAAECLRHMTAERALELLALLWP